jgi:uncharacterized membrane protein
LVLALLASASASAQTAQAEPPEILTFLGRFHPLLVHIPIGFLFVAFMLEVFSRFQRYRELRHAVTFILLLGTISAVASAVMGYFLSLSGGYEADTLFWHQWLGIGVAALSVLAYVLKVNADRWPAFPGGRVYFPVFVLAVFLTMGAGHYGGALTHGSDYLTQYMPQAPADAGRPAAPPEADTVKTHHQPGRGRGVPRHHSPNRGGPLRQLPQPRQDEGRPAHGLAPSNW